MLGPAFLATENNAHNLDTICSAEQSVRTFVNSVMSAEDYAAVTPR